MDRLGKKAHTYRLFSVLIIMVFVLGIGGCGPKENIKIGVAGTMSGKNSDLSVSGRRGIELAVTKLNESGGVLGRKFELVVKDDENNAETAMKIEKEFLNEKVSLVIGHFTSGMVMGVIDFVNANDMLLIGPTISADSLSAKDDHFVRFIASTKEQAMVLSDIAAKRGHKTFAIVYDIRNKGFTDQLVKNFEELFLLKTGLEVTVFSCDPSKEEDLSSVMKGLGELNPDGLFLIAGAEDGAKIAQLLHLKNIKPKLYGPLWANTPELIRKGGDAVNGMVVVGGLKISDESKDLVTFKEAFRKAYGEEATFASLYSYEAMMALAEGISIGRDTKPDTVKKALLEKKTFNGLQGTYILDKYGDTTRDYLLFEIDNGSLRKVE